MEARQKDWWQAYNDTLVVPLIGLEAEAASIRTYEPLLVPGLFQTEAVPDTVYIEQPKDDMYLESAEEVQRYARAFENLRAMALEPDASSDLLLRLSKEL